MPCNANNEPIEYNKTASEIFADDKNHCRVISKEEYNYQQALGRVLFKGFEAKYAKYETDITVLIHSESSQYFAYLEKEKWVFYDEFTALEHLTPYNLELTEKLIKDLEI